MNINTMKAEIISLYKYGISESALSEFEKLQESKEFLEKEYCKCNISIIRGVKTPIIGAAMRCGIDIGKKVSKISTKFEGFCYYLKDKRPLIVEKYFSGVCVETENIFYDDKKNAIYSIATDSNNDIDFITITWNGENERVTVVASMYGIASKELQYDVDIEIQKYRDDCLISFNYGSFSYDSSEFDLAECTIIRDDEKRVIGLCYSDDEEVYDVPKNIRAFLSKLSDNSI